VGSEFNSEDVGLQKKVVFHDQSTEELIFYNTGYNPNALAVPFHSSIIPFQSILDTRSDRDPKRNYKQNASL